MQVINNVAPGHIRVTCKACCGRELAINVSDLTWDQGHPMGAQAHWKVICVCKSAIALNTDQALYLGAPKSGGREA